MRHFISTQDWAVDELQALFDEATRLKSHPVQPLLQGRTLALLFLNRSLRTRASFQIGAAQLGATAIVLEPGKQVRIGEYRLALKGTVPLPEPQAFFSAPDQSAPSWPGLEPGWLEQLQMFQRALLRLDNPRGVLERLAEEFHRIARPQMVAVGLNTPDGYSWEVVYNDPSANGIAESLHQQEAAR